MNEVDQLIQLFQQTKDPNKAIPMEKYMRNQFPFLGIQTTLRRELMRTFYKETGLLKQEYDETFVAHVWELPEREFQYAGLDYMERSLRKLSKVHMKELERLITTKSWWDTVDVIAPKAVGQIAAHEPEVIEEYLEKWAYSENFWLRRAAILFQLKYKEKTDEELLFRYARDNGDSREFFIQKAIGWALREYSKTNPTSVRNFIETTTLSKLSIREGSKYI